MAAPDTSRIFVAIALPEDVKGEVTRLLERLQKGAIFTGAAPGWVRPEGVHITLAFLGDQNQEGINAAIKSMGSACRRRNPFKLSISGLFFFPSEKEPRTIAFQIKKDVDAVQDLSRNLSGFCRANGFAVASRDFNPHLTLARLKSRKGFKGLRGLLESHRRTQAGVFEVDSITLYKSTLQPGGSVYDVLHVEKFGSADSD